MNKKILLIGALLINLTNAEYSAKIFIDNNIKFTNESTPSVPPTSPDLGDIDFISNYTNGQILPVTSSGNNFSNINDPANTYNVSTQVVGGLSHIYTNNGSGNANLWIDIRSNVSSSDPYELDSSAYSNSKLINYFMDYYNAGMPSSDSAIRALNPIVLTPGESLSLPFIVRSNYAGLNTRNVQLNVKALTDTKSFTSSHNLSLTTPYVSNTISTGETCLRSNTNHAPTYCNYDVSTLNKVFEITLYNPTDSNVNITNVATTGYCVFLINPSLIPAGGSSNIRIDMTDCPEPWANHTGWVDVGVSLSNGMGMAFRLRGN